MQSRITLGPRSFEAAQALSFWFVLFFVITFPISVAAEVQNPGTTGDVPAARTRGLVTSAPCPYSCMDEGLTKDVCRERQLGTICEIEDFTQAPGHRSMIRVPKADVDNMSKPQRLGQSSAPVPARVPGRRGLVTSAQCPYSCKDAGLTAEECQEMQLGEVCQIEDFTQAPGHRSLVRVPQES